VARKSRKYHKQQGRLALPALEMAYIFQAIAHAPKTIIISKMLPEIEIVLRELQAHKTDPSKYQDGHGYWDDFCLARLLEGICARYVAFAVGFLCFWTRPYSHVDF
jgi:hypothetical protein